MTQLLTTRMFGQDSFLLVSDCVELAITVLGGMLGPVTFFPQEATAIRPYAIAPWALEELPAGTPPMLAALRGDWFCSAFGENAEPHCGLQLPPHGETANGSWHYVGRGGATRARWLQLGLPLPLQGGRCLATTALLDGEPVIYQQHDLDALSGPINPGHHATLAFPDCDGAGRLSFGPLIHARTYCEPMERPARRGYSWLQADVEIVDLHAVPCIDGTTTDLCSYPARRGFEDAAILCADPRTELAWSAVTFPEQRFAWFALRDPRQLSSTLLWFSNGGRHYPPWNGRHVNVLGIEDITAFFHVGLAASCRPNRLTERGVPTCLAPAANGRLSVRYIQGVVRIPAGFDRVASIHRDAGGASMLLTAESGASASVPCQSDFLLSGRLRGLELPRAPFDNA
jgi:hypothetical protein